MENSLIDLVKNKDFDNNLDYDLYKNQIGGKNKFGITSLMFYCIYNKNPSIKIVKLLEKEKDINNDKNITPLMCYCLNQSIEQLDPEIIKLFKNQIGKKDIDDITALMFYLSNNKNPSIEDIEIFKDEINIFNIKNQTPLIYYSGNTNIENLDLKIIEYFSNQISLKDNFNNTSLFYYLKHNKNPTLEGIECLKKEIDIYNYNNFTLLICYCLNENADVLNPKIIEYFSNQIGVQNNYNNTFLQYYLSYNKNPTIEIIKLLKDEININNNQTSLMSYCINKKINNLNLEIIEYFFNQIGKQDNKGYTALAYYLLNNKNPNIEIIELLKNEKEIYDYENYTPLMYYCCNETIENLDSKIINYFSNQINLKNYYGYTALYYYTKYNKNLNSENINLLGYKVKLDLLENTYNYEF